ncbi:hypothetical protein [Chlorogloeopsis sp. ULAP02]|uniref:O-antigen ligase family protein n=1 Tax=Chlorogloeopsis sp. ULAP02 TaxID=3107926 RepID=UPI0031354181
MSRLSMWDLPTQPKPLVFSWIFFSFFIFLSGYINNDITVMRDGIWFMIFIPIIFFSILPKLMNKYATSLIPIGLFLGVTPYIVASFVINPVWQSQEGLYRGVFANSNQLGFMAAVMSASIFIFLISALSNNKGLFTIGILYLLLLLSLGVILLANARTSLLVFIVLHIMFLKKMLQRPNYVIFSVITVIFTILIAIFVIPNDIFSLLLEQISRIQDKDSLSGREYIWLKTFIDMQLLGNGSDYFEKNFGLGAHNTLIDILGINGIIAMLIIMFFAISSFFYAFSYFQKYAKEEKYASTPLIITTCFWVLSMGEGLFGSLGSAITIAYLLSMGVIITKKTTDNINHRFNNKEREKIYDFQV